MFGEEELVKIHKQRADQIWNIIVICFSCIIMRLWYLQVFKGDELYRYSVENSLRKEIVRAPRGMVFSRNNDLMIFNAPRFDAYVVPQYLPKGDVVLQRASEILAMPIDTIKQILKKNAYQARYKPVLVKKNISRKELAQIETESNKLPGFNAQPFISREYRDNEIGSHLLGYIAEVTPAQIPQFAKSKDKYVYQLGDFIGQAGLEKNYDLILRGDDGYDLVEVDARGRKKKHFQGDAIFQGIENKESIPGNNVRLTIDRDLQLTAWKALEGKVGGAVAVDVNTGEILSMVSRPGYEPSVFSTGFTREYWSKLVNDDNHPLRDKTMQEHYSPGSTYKTIVALAALEEGIVKPETEFMCGGSYRFGNRSYNDWKKEGHGVTNVYKSLRSSVDVYYYRLATQMDIDTLSKYSNLLGLGQKTGVNLPNETTGIIPSRKWKKQRFGEEWQPGETLSCFIGGSYVNITLMQMLMAYSAIANNGSLWKPYIVKEVFSNTGKIVKEYKPELVRKLNFKPETFKAVQRGLWEVVNMQGGTGYNYRGQGIQMAGKTGTAQVRSMTRDQLFSKCENMPYRNRHNGLFIGYAPADKPKIAVAVVVEHGCHGTTAAPIARDVISKYLDKYYPEERERLRQFEKENKMTPGPLSAVDVQKKEADEADRTEED